ncbi:MAG TPA: transglutaminase family protein [Spirochaetota bacterium]|nr:transglutaminase family protein [Spirochaetota bacterium]HOD14807.1 transglutaminase family protein [Spirochaetota bacterium]HPG50208.1 transglutaminase family protein [Spirochaetota bacterium]HPN11324.1 transglutaminase family protein [Spirochaetota bacterium]HQL82155.1 transglutaminase family protein [Spirochaetota bacterium]
MNDLSPYLKSTAYIDSDSPAIMAHARSIVSPDDGDVEKAVKLFYAVRDCVRYNPYRMSVAGEDYVASRVLAAGEGFCVQKAVLLAALSRASGVPCRLRFAIVKNHLVTKRLRDLMGTDLFAFHGFNEFHLDGRWVKATPAFNLSLCEKFGILPLDFDGSADSILHPFDASGRQHMEYLHDYGPFEDLPVDLMMEEFGKYYPAIMKALEARQAGPAGDFEREADDEKRGEGR